MARSFQSHQPKPARRARKADPAAAPEPAKPAAEPDVKPTGKPKEIGGPSGPEPTRYGDWERKGICVDF